MKVLILRQLISGAIFLFIITGNAYAEKFFDLYGGINSTNNSTADVVDELTSAPGIRGTISLDFDSDVTLGMRAGTWLENHPHFGMALDISYFSAEADNAAVFTEYRYTHLKVDFDADESFWSVPNPQESEVETDLDTHHALVGMSFLY